MNNNPAKKLLALMKRGPEFDRRVMASAEVMGVVSRIRDVMEKRGLSKSDLAARLGVARGQVGRWFNDETGMNAKTIFMIADALDCDVEVKIIPREEALVAVPRYAAKVIPLRQPQSVVRVKPQPFARAPSGEAAPACVVG